MTNTVTNPNSSPIHFFCPNHLKVHFDKLTKYKRVSRTSIINSLIENWMRDEFQKMKQDSEMNVLFREIGTKPNPSKKQGWFSSKSSSNLEPPVVPSIENDHYQDDWTDISGLNKIFGDLK